MSDHRAHSKIMIVITYSAILLLLLSAFFPSKDKRYHNKSITTIKLITGDHPVQHCAVIFCCYYHLKEPLSILALRLHRLQVQRGLHLSSAELRPQRLTLLFSSPHTFHPAALKEKVSPLSIPLPQCFHPALITPICRHSSTCLSLSRPPLRFHHSDSGRSAALHH